MDLREDAEVTTGQPLDDVGLPQRFAAVHRTGDQASEEILHVIPSTPVGNRHVTHMAGDVEVRIVDPVGAVEPEGHLHQSTAERFEQRQLLLELREEDRVRVEVGVVRSGVDREAAHVTEGVAGLEVQETRVDAGELFHRKPFGREHMVSR